MKKRIIRLVVCLIVFFATIITAEFLTNSDSENSTTEMGEAHFPLIYVRGSEMQYNELHGFVSDMDITGLRGVVSGLSQDRGIDFLIEPYGNDITGLKLEVRNIDGSRLIEEELLEVTQAGHGRYGAACELKDLIEKDTEYMLTLTLSTTDYGDIRYYTRLFWGDELFIDEKLAFVADFHEKLFDRDAAKSLTMYLETNPGLESNRSFYNVNIHSSFKQLTYGDMKVREEMTPSININELLGTATSLELDTIVSTEEDKKYTYYKVKEYYRIRYTPDRTYLLNYERYMTELPETDNMYANDKLLLGITDDNVELMESEDGGKLAFVAGDRLYGYDSEKASIAVLFAFHDNEGYDRRDYYDRHRIKILNIDEVGNVQFAVYGYMNRGRREGEVGICVYNYDSTYNTLEELVYIPCKKDFGLIENDVSRLLYLSRGEKLYLWLDGGIYCVNIPDKSSTLVENVTRDGVIHVSDNGRIMISLNTADGSDIYHCSSMIVRNLNNETENIITVEEDEAVRPLGFMGEDIIYGVAKLSDVDERSAGSVHFPMYKVCIMNSDGKLLKSYERENVYVTECSIESNQISLKREEKLENGGFKEIADEQIMNNLEENAGKNTVSPADIDVYERYVQIKTKSQIDVKNMKVLTPKEVLYEGSREVEILNEEENEHYIVYGLTGVRDVCINPATALSESYDAAGVMTDKKDRIIWYRGRLAAKNQIMSISESAVTDEKDSLSVCVDSMLKYEGVIRNSEYLFAQGYSVYEILDENLPFATVLDLSGCSLEAILFFVNQDIPVLSIRPDNTAVLLVGYNDSQVVLMDPLSGNLDKVSRARFEEEFAGSGASLLTYIKFED
ncbi:MAG: hypothetical protein IJ608_12435 [Lachnospiraceae bacterium]|nr:hypothetical protein [Lachnospiraceae bacterium]